MKVDKKKQKVFVGMSGGVDSSVSALLLKNQGYDVTGVFIKVWQPEFLPVQAGFEPARMNKKEILNRSGGCTWRQDRLDAMRVCAKLNIPFITLNLEKEYKKEVVDYMIEEYKKGRTPNPDVMCNKYVKFGGFFDWVMKQGADFVATGHYARRHIGLAYGVNKKSKSKNKHSNILKNVGMSYELLAGKDKNKDQSYFLWTLTQKQLSKTLFPVGDIEKPEVRKLAEKYDLSTAVKKDSQGLCFIGKIDIKDFLKNYIKEKKGSVLDESGKIIGEHDGAFYLTVGQRHGFKLNADFMRTLRGQSQTNSDLLPYYIISKDIKNNTITVSHSPKLANDESKIVKVENVNWISGVIPDLSKKYSARIRYRQSLEECRIVPSSKLKVQSIYELHFTKPQKAITSGQSAVIYDACPNSSSGRGDVCLGGGIIK